MYLFGPERVCSVRSAIAGLATPPDNNQIRQFTLTVINMTTSASAYSSLQQRQRRLQAEDMTTRLYSRHAFCLVTKGDSYSTASLYMAIMNNCMPIVIGDWFILLLTGLYPTTSSSCVLQKMTFCATLKKH